MLEFGDGYGDVFHGHRVGKRGLLTGVGSAKCRIRLLWISVRLLDVILRKSREEIRGAAGG